jgi:hypothetical protein
VEIGDGKNGDGIIVCALVIIWLQSHHKLFNFVFSIGTVLCPASGNIWGDPHQQETAKPAKVYSKGGTFAKYFCLFPHSGKSFVFFLTLSGFCLILLSFLGIAK